MAYGMTEGLGSPRCAATSGWTTRAASDAASAAPRSASSTTAAMTLAAGRVGEIYMRAPRNGCSATSAAGAAADATVDGFSTGGDIG